MEEVRWLEGRAVSVPKGLGRGVQQQELTGRVGSSTFFSS